MTHLSKNRLLLVVLAGLSFSCEPYNLERATFPVCAKPSATINYVSDRLEASLFLEDKVGDIGAIGWNLGDGRYKIGERVKVAYSKPGTYTLTVILANPCDDRFTATRSITVTN